MPRYEIAIEYAEGLRAIQVVEAATPEIALKFAEAQAAGWSFTVRKME
jgi:hypothetical protein